MLKDRLKDLDIKITELANYLNISRPTMYKFIEYYDECNYKDINKKIVKLFDYIMNNEMIGKNNVINYILNNLANLNDLDITKDSSTMKLIKKFIEENPNDVRIEFLDLCLKKDYYNDVIKYLIEITPLLKKKKYSTEELQLLKPYNEILNIYEGRK